MENGKAAKRLRRVLPRPILETLSFRGVAPSEEILLLARELADALVPLLGADGRCELGLVQERWLTGTESIEARVHATFSDAPLTVFAQEATAIEAVRSVFRSLEGVLVDLIADGEEDEAPDAGWPRSARAVT